MDPAAAHSSVLDVPRGLKGVIVTDTELGDVRGEEGFFHYRQYDATELARYRTFEDVWCLLLDGTLPDADGSATFGRESSTLRVLPDGIGELARLVARRVGDETVLAGLAAAFATAGSLPSSRPVLDITEDERRASARALAAWTPTFLAAAHRHRQGLPPLAPREELGHAANYLWMVTGTDPVPDHVRALETYLILTIDHGFNASTFTSRRSVHRGERGIGADAAACRPWRDPHGGAPSRALDALDAIGTPDAAASDCANELAAGRRLMGFGQRSTARGTHARSCCAPSPKGSEASWSTGQWGSRIVAALERAKPGQGAVCERRVLRRGRDGTLWDSPLDVHSDLRREPGRGMDGERARTGARHEDHPPFCPVRGPAGAGSGPHTVRSGPGTACR
ncbi:MAG: citrate/2-methylcitrate synthase [Ilumatobacteraceae bacterium]